MEAPYSGFDTSSVVGLIPTVSSCVTDVGSCDLSIIMMMMLFPQYEVKAPMPSACFRNVCKQMAKMHEAISELLPEEQTQVRINTASF